MEKMSISKIEKMINLIRGQRVMLDSDSDLDEVETIRLNEQVTRNMERFPDDFMFQLTVVERDILRSQFATLKHSIGARLKRFRPVVVRHDLTLGNHRVCVLAA